MNVEQLLRVLSELPGDMPIAVDDSRSGWMENAALYVAPAHIDRRVSGNYLHSGHRDGAENCCALLISGFALSGEGVVDITPETPWLRVIDADADIPHQRP